MRREYDFKKGTKGKHAAKLIRVVGATRGSGTQEPLGSIQTGTAKKVSGNKGLVVAQVKRPARKRRTLESVRTTK